MFFVVFILLFCEEDGDHEDAEEADEEDVECIALGSVPFRFFFESAAWRVVVFDVVTDRLVDELLVVAAVE